MTAAPTPKASLRLWLATKRPLGEVCSALGRELGLPPFEYDHENENEWGVSKTAELTVHCSRAYESATFHAWDSRCPPGANLSVRIAARLDELGGREGGRLPDDLLPRCLAVLAPLAEDHGVVAEEANR